jgi:hypothetical protein
MEFLKKKTIRFRLMSACNCCACCARRVVAEHNQVSTSAHVKLNTNAFSTPSST